MTQLWCDSGEDSPVHLKNRAHICPDAMQIWGLSSHLHGFVLEEPYVKAELLSVIHSVPYSDNQYQV